MPGQNRKNQGRQGHRTYSVNTRENLRAPSALEGPPGLATSQAATANLQRSVSYQVQLIVFI